MPPRSHTWDKHTGRYRLDSTNKEGKKQTVLMNVTTRQGTAWLDGEPLAGEELKAALEQAYAAWTNDTYWLLMPYKLRDPGVVLSHDGEERSADGAWDKLVLTFDDVGLTPKDKYWVYVNRSTHRIDRWDYVLKGGPGPPTSWLWTGWKRYGSIMLAPERVNTKDTTRIFFPVLDAPPTLDDATLTRP
jgi:hypothetical protein